MAPRADLGLARALRPRSASDQILHHLSLFELLLETYDVPADDIFSDFHTGVSAAAQSVVQGELVQEAQTQAQVPTALLGDKDTVGYVL